MTVGLKVLASAMMAGLLVAGTAQAAPRPVHVVWTQPTAAPRVHRILLNGRALNQFDDALTVRKLTLKVDVFCPTQKSGPTKIAIIARPGEWLYLKPAASGCGLSFDRIAAPSPVDRSLQRT